MAHQFTLFDIICVVGRIEAPTWYAAQENVDGLLQLDGGTFNLLPVLERHAPHHMHDLKEETTVYLADLEELRVQLSPEAIMDRYAWIDFEVYVTDRLGRGSVFLNSTRNEDGLHRIHIPQRSKRLLQLTQGLPFWEWRFDLPPSSQRLLSDLSAARLA